MKLRSKKFLTPTAQKLRREMTASEKQLWYHFLKDCPARFRRQHVIGHYIVDFYCSSAHLVVELDGSIHETPQALADDAERDENLEALGLHVLRFQSREVFDSFPAVCAAISSALVACGPGDGAAQAQ